MRIIDPMIHEFEHEMASTRKVLERVPDEHLSWKPHEKSMTLGRLASHLAEIPEWAVNAIEQDELNIEPDKFKAANLESREAILALFDKNVSSGKESMGKAGNEILLNPWIFKVNGNEVFRMPKIAVLRSWVLNHMYHHRGQLNVFLRLKDVPLPQVYGPTADEPGMTG